MWVEERLTLKSIRNCIVALCVKYLVKVLIGILAGTIGKGYISGYTPARSHGQFLLILHPLQKCCLQSKVDAVYDKAVVC